MKRSVAFVVVAVAGLVLVGAGAATWLAMRHDVKGPLHPWTDKPLANDPETFHFAIIGDLTGNERPGVFVDAVEKLNLMQPEFVMSVGDLIQGYTDDEAKLDAEWKSFRDRLAGLQMRFFYLSGNHDIGGGFPEKSRKAWQERFGPTYYHFVYRNVLFLCLDSELLMVQPHDQAEADRQIEYVKKTLAANKDVRWTFLFMHKPLWTAEEVGVWAPIATLLADRPRTVFSGHWHTYTKYVRDGRSHIILGTTGAGTLRPEPEFGCFDHIVWVTVKKDGPVIANLMLDGIHDENVRTEAMANAQEAGTYVPKVQTPVPATDGK